MHHLDYNKHLPDGIAVTMIDHFDPIIDMSTECHYNPDYWMQYKNGSTPMKEMEGIYVQFRYRR